MAKKILLISNRLEPGGAEIYVVSIANRLSQAGYTIFVASTGGQLVKKLEKSVVHFIIPSDAKSILKIIECSIKLNRILKDNPVDIIHTNSVMTCVIAKLATILKPIPIVNTVHSWGTNKNILSAQIVNNCAHKVIAVSKSTADKYISNGLKKEKVTVIHNGVDVEQFKKLPEEQNVKTRQQLHINTDDFVVINIARMEEERKGHETLLKAAQIVINKYPATKFVLIGDGYLKKSLEERVEEYNIQQNCLFLGNNINIVDVLSMSDIFCLPSYWEGLPIVIAEAMSCGLPVVASDVSGIPEIVVDQETGFLVKPKDPTELADKIILMIENPEKVKTMSLNARERIKEHFNFNKLIQELEKVYV